MLFALLLSLTTSFSASASSGADYKAPLNVASLGACSSRALDIEINVDGQTTKHEMIDAIKLLADYPDFTITPEHSEQSTLRFTANLKDNCVSDSCARVNGWFDIQKRLERFKGVAVTCAAEKTRVGRPVPQPGAPPEAPGMPGPGGGQGQWPPPPRDGGATGGN